MTSKKQKANQFSTRASPIGNDVISFAAESIDGDNSLVIDDSTSICSTDAGIVHL